LFPLFANDIVDMGGKVATGTGGKIFKKIQMTLMLFLGAWGKMTHEKNLKQKIS
jgi:hypothetical protein